MQTDGFCCSQNCYKLLGGNLCKSIAKVGNLWYTNRAWCDEAGSCCGQQVISVEHVRQSDAGGTEPESLVFKGFARCCYWSFEARTPSSFGVGLLIWSARRGKVREDKEQGRYRHFFRECLKHPKTCQESCRLLQGWKKAFANKNLH